jgi:HEAT repeat protein
VDKGRIAPGPLWRPSPAASLSKRLALPRDDPLRDRLALLRQIRQQPDPAEHTSVLRDALREASNQLVAEAARVVGELELAELEVDQAAAFERFMIRPTKSDPGCTAKQALAEALYRLGSGNLELFLQGIHHKQMEPVYGGKADTAAPLRAVCALGLVRAGYPGVLEELAELLADPEVDARVGAARALAYASQPGAVPLLRYKCLIGDPHAQVSYECFTGLLQLDRRASPAFVARFLDNQDEAVGEAAFLALGESRLEGAFPHLKAAWEALDRPALARVALTALALLRLDDAVDYLLEVLATAEPEAARLALETLDLYRDDGRIWPRVMRAARQRDDLDLGGKLV